MDPQLDIHAGGTELPLPADFRWPGGKRIAVFFRVAFEWWSDGKWPGIGPMGNPLQAGVPDLNAVGWAEYGHRRGIFRALDTFKRHGNSPRVMLDVFEDWLGYARKYETGAARMDPAIHTHVFGRPTGMAIFQRVMEMAKAADDIWIGTLSQAAAHVRATLKT